MKKLFFIGVLLMAMATVFAKNDKNDTILSDFGDEIKKGAKKYYHSAKDHVKRHWKKYAAGAATIGLGAAAYLNRDKLGSYRTGRQNQALKTTNKKRSNLVSVSPQSATKPSGSNSTPSDSNSTLSGSNSTPSDSNSTPSGSKLENQGAGNSLRTRFSQVMKQLGGVWNRFRGRFNEYTERAGQGQQERKDQQRNLEERFQKNILPKIKNRIDFMKSHLIGATIINPGVKAIDYFIDAPGGGLPVGEIIDREYNKRAVKRLIDARNRVKWNPSSYEDID